MWICWTPTHSSFTAFSISTSTLRWYIIRLKWELVGRIFISKNLEFVVKIFVWTTSANYQTETKGRRENWGVHAHGGRFYHLWSSHPSKLKSNIQTTYTLHVVLSGNYYVQLTHWVRVAEVLWGPSMFVSHTSSAVNAQLAHWVIRRCECSCNKSRDWFITKTCRNYGD